VDQNPYDPYQPQSTPLGGPQGQSWGIPGEASIPSPGPGPTRDRLAQRWTLGRRAKAAVGGGLVLGLVLGGAGVGMALASASTSTSSNSGSGSTSSPPPMPAMHHPGRGHGWGPGGPLGIGGLGGRVLHGEFTISTPSGYKTVEVQTGKVTAVSSSSLTVSSADGFSQTYKVLSDTIVDAQAGGISSVSDSDQVTVVASVASGTSTATDVIDHTKVAASGRDFGFGPGSRSKAPASQGTASSGSATA